MIHRPLWDRTTLTIQLPDITTSVKNMPRSLIKPFLTKLNWTSMNSSNTSNSYRISINHCRMILMVADPRLRIRRGCPRRKNPTICLTWKLKMLQLLSSSRRRHPINWTSAILSKSNRTVCGMPLPNRPWLPQNNWSRHSNKRKPTSIIVTICTARKANKIPKTCSMKRSKSLSSWLRNRLDVI